MPKIKNWKKIVNNETYHSGGGIYVDMQRWKNTETGAQVEVVVASPSRPKSTHGDIEIYSEKAGYVGAAYGEEGSRTATKRKLAKVATSWMKKNPQPKEDYLVNQAVDDLQNKIDV